MTTGAVTTPLCRLGPQGDTGSVPTSIHQLQPSLALQLDQFTPDRTVAMCSNGNSCNSYRWTTVFVDVEKIFFVTNKYFFHIQI